VVKERWREYVEDLYDKTENFPPVKEDLIWKKKMW
jgi:hypothetical protein